MIICSKRLAPTLLFSGALLLALLASKYAQAQKLDLNSNGMSDVWEQIYNASALNPNLDSDGDGVSNLQESMAGTDPFDPNSVPRIPTTAYSSSNFSITLPAALGKQYQLQSVQPQVSGWTNWTVESTIIARTGTVVTLTAPIGSAPKFFRVGIADVDTDGDGLNDWEEYQLGLDPTKPFSNNQLDGVGQPMGDYAYAAARIASQNVISITAADPTCVQPDAGQTAGDLGQFTISRGGFPLNSITVNLATGGPGTGYATPGVDHLPLPTSIFFPPGVGSTTVSLRPLADTSLLSPVVAMLKVLPGAGYTLSSASNASIIIYPSQTATGTGLTGQYYTNASATYASSVNFNAANLKMTRVDPTVDFTWGTTSLPFANNGYYCVRWTGQIQPQYSEKYFFVVNSDDGFKLWVNDQLIIDDWVSKSASDVTGSITLQAGVRYNIKLEYFQLTGSAVAHLSWYSPSQPKQIIPASRLYPSSGNQAPTVLISPRTAVAFLNQPFNFTVAGANSAALYSASPLPPGLSFNTSNGLISGSPSLAGDFQVFLTASNSVGVSASVLDITVFDTGSSVVREVWTNAPGVNISDIPLGTTPSSIAALGTLEGITDFGDNYAERIRGYITAPATANYYFWIAGSDSAELWISNDSEPANKVRRAYVSPTGTASRQWTVQPNQKSGWLSLVAGQKYYIEVLHKAGVGAGDNWSVGYLQDPTGTNNTPTGVVPSYLHSPYYAPPASVAPGTLYVATMLPGIGVTNMPVGSATLRLSADNSRGVLNFSLAGVSSTIISEHIDNDPYLGSPSGIMFDISDTVPQADGSFLWNIGPVGTLSAADVLEVLKEGKGYITVLTDYYPGGELIGHFEAALGSTSFTAPPPPPAWTDDHADPSAASRFLIQSTFGPSPSDVATVQSIGYNTWINNQFALPATHHLPLLYAKKSPDPSQPSYPGTTLFNTWWQQSITAPDQLRQRMAFALSEIMVVSDQGVLQDNGVVLSSYYDTLLDNAFGNFRDILKAVTLHPAMGLFLNMQGNDKGNIITGTHANENYAREIMQLFSVGLNRMWPDGTLVMDSTGEIVPTYNQDVILGMAAVFTGWNYYQTDQANGRLPTSFSPPANYTNGMVLVPTHHDLNTKLLLDNVVLPAAQGTFADPNNTNYDIYCSQDLELALNSIFYNQNVGPFICRQLIQRLVTSSPSPGYLYRVVQTFNDNGAGVRGDMQAVINAILLDYEARSSASLSNPTFGKEREPLLRVTAMARAFPAPAPITGNYSQPTNQVIYFNTDTPHRLTNNEIVAISFTDTSGLTAPPSQSYSITVQSPTRFTFNAPGMASGTYTQVANTTVSNALTGTIDTTNVIFVSISGHGAVLGQSVYLHFVNNGTTDGVYQIVSATNGNNFAVETANSFGTNGASVMPKLISGGGFTISRATNATFTTAMPHGLNPGDSVYVNFSVSPPADGQFQVVTVPNPTNFTIVIPNTGNGSLNGQTIFPLIPPPLSRSGTVSVQYGNFSFGATDTGNTASLAQTPLNSPTVFNFFFPDYKYPGALATAGLTTPEFQLTSDTTVEFQMNFLSGGILLNANNTNGLSSFNSGGGGIYMDISPWMTTAYASNAGLPGLVDALNSLLCGGQLSPAAKTQIVNYAATLAYTTPTAGQIRDRVRAVIHLISNSPDYTVQR